MTDIEIDRETTRAVEALAGRTRSRDAAVRDSDPDLADPELFAREFMTMLLGYGWRLTLARVTAMKDQLHGGAGLPVGDEARGLVADLKARLASAGEPEDGAA